MIEIRLIDSLHKADINIPNEPFELRGRMIPSYNGEKWDYTISSLPKEKVTQMCFPDENYCFEEMDKDLFLGAYDGDRCVGLDTNVYRHTNQEEKKDIIFYSESVSDIS